jgi:heterogeneous nuclear rnp K-like protein
MEVNDYVQAAAKSNGYDGSNQFTRPLPAGKPLFPDSAGASHISQAGYGLGYTYSPQNYQTVGTTDQSQLMSSTPDQPITQQIYFPNDTVSGIIGKGDTKINEIQQLSGSVINDTQDNSNERLVTIAGTAESNQMTLYMLYSRLGMSSKSSS